MVSPERRGEERRGEERGEGRARRRIRSGAQWIDVDSRHVSIDKSEVPLEFTRTSLENKLERGTSQEGRYSCFKRKEPRIVPAKTLPAFDTEPGPQG